MRIIQPLRTSPKHKHEDRYIFPQSVTPYSRKNKYYATTAKRLEKFDDTYLKHHFNKTPSISPGVKKLGSVIRDDLKSPSISLFKHSKKANSRTPIGLPNIHKLSPKNLFDLKFRPQSPFMDEKIQLKYEEIRKHFKDIF